MTEDITFGEVCELREEVKCIDVSGFAVLVVCMVGLLVICRQGARACCALGRRCQGLVQGYYESRSLEIKGAELEDNPRPPRKEIHQHGNNEDFSGPALYYGSDLSGQDARNLVVALCRLHDCKDDFIKLLLTLLEGVILPTGNTLSASPGLPTVNINPGAKEFFADCEGQLHLKERKCMRGHRAALLEECSVRATQNPYY